MTTSADLGLPFLSGGQGQPEVTHNQALFLLQGVLNGALSLGDNTPPGGPTDGDTYVLGSSPTGAWAGRANCIAIYNGSSWDFIPGEDSNGTPITMGARQVGLRIYIRDLNALYIWADSGASPADYEWREYIAQNAPSEDYGQLTVSQNSTALAITAAGDSTLYTNGDYTQITGIWDAIPHGENNGITQQTNSITIARDGVYRIEFWGNITADASNVNVAAKFAIDGTISLVRRPRVKIGSSGDVQGVAAHGFVQLSAGNIITLWHACDTSCNVTYEDVVFSVHEMRRL